jgi:hypothetical protein
MEEKTAAAGTPASGCFLCTTALPLIERLWPQDTSEHFRNARIEFLKGVRTLIDHQIVRLSHEQAKGTHVTVE